MDDVLVNGFESIDDESCFVIDNDAKCDWALEKINEARDAIARNNTTAEEIMAKKKAYVDAWLEQENSTANNTIEFMKAKIREYSLAKLEKINEGKKKPVHSFNLPSGKVAWKKKADEFSIGGVKCSKDNAELLKLMKSTGNRNFINQEIKESVDWADLKKCLFVTPDGNVVNTVTGEILPIDVKIGEYELNV